VSSTRTNIRYNLNRRGSPSPQISPVKAMSSELRKIQSSNRTYAHAYPRVVCASRSSTGGKNNHRSEPPLAADCAVVYGRWGTNEAKRD
jgi:hypothetical protein